MKFIFKTISIILILGCSLGCSKSTIPEKPPKGYPNETIVKIALATKLLKVIDTEPEVPAELEVFKNIEYKNVDSFSLQLDIYKQKDQKEIFIDLR